MQIFRKINVILTDGQGMQRSCTLEFAYPFFRKGSVFMIKMKSLTRERKFLLLALIPAYFIVAGLLLQPLEGILEGVYTMIREPDFLITDYIAVGGIGAAFINAGALTLMSIGFIYFLDMEMDGHTITSSCLMFGFSLFGKNLMNIWAILLGVLLYAKYHKTSLSKYIYV